MTDRISPQFHAEIIVLLFDEHQDLRKVTERVGILLSDASAEHVEAVGKYLPIDLMRALPRRMLRSMTCGGASARLSAMDAAFLVGLRTESSTSTTGDHDGGEDGGAAAHFPRRARRGRGTGLGLHPCRPPRAAVVAVAAAVRSHGGPPHPLFRRRAKQRG
jgi:hypothetical protein